MKGFGKYLYEMAAASSSEKNDDKGKLHELLLAKHIHPQGVLPMHHRTSLESLGASDKNLKTPEEVHKFLKAKMNPAAYDEINNHAKQTADAVRTHLKNNGYKDHEIHNVHWTSNRDTAKKAGDHEKTTGVKDVNSNADLIVTAKHKKTGQVHHVGVSAKYGTEEQPNFRNDGLAALEKKTGLNAGTLTAIQKEHDDAMASKLGYKGTKAERHEQYKVGRDKKSQERDAHKAKMGSNKGFMPKHKESLRAREAENYSVNARKKMARHIDNALNTMDDHQLRELIRKQVSPSTHIHHIVAHSHVQDDGNAVSRVGDMHNLADSHLDNFQNLRVKPGTGIYSQIVGDHNGKERAVAQQIIKAGSGPMKGSAGAFKLVSIPKSKESGAPAPVEKPVKKVAAKSATPKSNKKVGNSGQVGGFSFNKPGE